MEEWEVVLNMHADKMEINVEYWQGILLDPGNIWGCITQFKQTLFLYWSMKSILVKFLEQISVGMTATIQDFPKYKQVFQKL